MKGKPTIKQRLAFNELLQAISDGKGLNMGAIMKKAGYSDASCINPSKILLESDGFKGLLSKIDDQVILAKFYSILLQDDKRASLEAGKELLKLKDRYPTTKFKAEGFGDEYKSLFVLNEKP